MAQPNSSSTPNHGAGGGNAVPSTAVTSQQLYAAGFVRDNRPIYLAGPFPTREEATAWVQDARFGAIVLPWPPDRFFEDQGMAKAEARRATYEDLLNTPEHLVAEILEGRLVTHPRPRLRHGLSATALIGILAPPFMFGRGGPGGWWFITEPELHFGEEPEMEVASPEIAGWRRERMPTVPDTAWTGLVPDWTCEVISPSSEKYDRGVKRDIYAKFGVTAYWLVDEKKRTLETFALKSGVLQLSKTYRDDGHVAAPPFAEMTFSLADLWAD